MDGDSAPLAAIHAATQAAGAVLLVDDAHGVGVVGDEGRGSCAAQAVRPELLVVTFGKAFGVSGAAVLCDEAMADYLLQFARHLIYSTAMPPAQAVALSAALRIIRSDEGQQRRDILAARIRQFRGDGRGVAGVDRLRQRDPAADRRRQRPGAEPGLPSTRRGLLGNGDPSTDGAGRQRAFAPDPDSRPSC